ncbi:MAG: SGNH/GDSL hydrolase family protein [Chloroflexi bacterium]|nr:SGNH/GDSL hydrolase family protein [Chloroflexota bacterium]
MKNSIQQPLKLVIQLVFSTLIALPFLWVNRTLDIQPNWSTYLAILIAITIFPLSIWEKLPRLSSALWQLITFFGTALLVVFTTWTTMTRHPGIAVGFLLTWFALLGVSLAYKRPGTAVNLTLATTSILVTLIFINIAAGVVLNGLENQTQLAEIEQTEIEPEPTIAEVVVETAVPQPTTTPRPPTSTPQPSPTPDPNIPSTPTPTPEPERPIAGFGYLEWLEDNGEADWVHLTAYGPRVNSIAHAYMLDVNGNTVYDTIVEYNGKGYRGPEATYEKPDDVYRILIIGDSFVEAIQVDYEKTFQALLQNQLSQHNTPDQQYEVIAMGRTGWGTVHETVYYQAEGHKYNADLVILMFYINDVADNYPRVFYPNINNTNYDFVIEQDNIRILDTNQEPLPPNSARLLFNALPSRLQQTNLARLLVRMGDPPVPVVTPGGVMTRVHPQFYIYVAEPEVDGYPEAWERTGDALRVFANDVSNDGAQFVVMPIFLGSEMVTNVSNWFPELVAGWQWDHTLPDQKLEAIMANLPGEVWSTQSIYEANATAVNGEVYNLIYLPEDGHFNELGHQWAFDAIYNWLQESKMIE